MLKEDLLGAICHIGRGNGSMWCTNYSPPFCTTYAPGSNKLHGLERLDLSKQDILPARLKYFRRGENIHPFEQFALSVYFTKNLHTPVCKTNVTQRFMACERRPMPGYKKIDESFCLAKFVSYK